jgi:hypothetical protein
MVTMQPSIADPPQADGERAEKLGDGGDLVGLRVDLDLSQDQAVCRCPGRDHVDRGLAACLVARAAQALPVERDHPSRKRRRDGFGPAQEAGLELLGVEGLEDAVEGVVGGDAVGQVEERLEPVDLGLPELLDIVPGLGAADDRAEGDRDDREQRMQLGPFDSRVFERREVLAEGNDQRCFGHGKLQTMHYRLLAYQLSPLSSPSPLRCAGPGYKLILSLGVHDPPTWVFGYPNSRYVNQFGQIYNLQEGLYDQGDANAVFNPKVRELMGSYIARVFADLGTDFVAVRIGGGRYGELTYPPTSYEGRTNAYWAFDANARASSPTPNWLPGQPSPNGEAKRFLEWYLDSLKGYEQWQIATLREHYTGPLMLLFPSWGIRPGEIDQAVGVNLNGSTSAEINGEVQRGYDFARQVSAIGDQGVVVTTTWLDADASKDSGSDPRFWSPVKYLASLANAHPLKLQRYGENTGQGNSATMQFAISQMKKYGLFGLAWFNESELYSGHYATIFDYQRLISQNGG